jgi:hypothetical protein
MPAPRGGTLRSRGRAQDQGDDSGEDFILDDISGDEDDIQPVPRARRSRTQATSTQPVAQVINDIVPASVSVPTTADVQYFFDKESADKVFCKECKYVDHLTHSFLQTKVKPTGRYETLIP